MDLPNIQRSRSRRLSFEQGILSDQVNHAACFVCHWQLPDMLFRQLPVAFRNRCICPNCESLASLWRNSNPTRGNLSHEWGFEF